MKIFSKDKMNKNWYIKKTPIEQFKRLKKYKTKQDKSLLKKYVTTKVFKFSQIEYKIDNPKENKAHKIIQGNG